MNYDIQNDKRYNFIVIYGLYLMNQAKLNM